MQKAGEVENDTWKKSWLLGRKKVTYLEQNTWASKLQIFLILCASKGAVKMKRGDLHFYIFGHMYEVAWV